jgi:DinB superfamily
MARKRLSLDESAARHPEVARWLSAMVDARMRTLEHVEGLGEELIDRLPLGHDNTIGSLLYHIAAIEADWLFEDVLGPESGRHFPEELFPFPVRDGEGRLWPVRGLTLVQHLDRLAGVRTLMVQALEAIDGEEFHRARQRPDYDVAPDWVVHHLLQHEAEHRAQIWAVRAAVSPA